MDDMLGYVKGRLHYLRGQHPTIARESGVTYRAVQKIHSGDTPNPGIQNLQKLYNYLKAKESL